MNRVELPVEVGTPFGVTLVQAIECAEQYPEGIIWFSFHSAIYEVSSSPQGGEAQIKRILNGKLSPFADRSL